MGERQLKKVFNHRSISTEDLMLQLFIKRAEQEENFPAPLKVESEKCEKCGKNAYLLHYDSEVKRYCLSDRCDERIGPPKSKAQKRVEFHWSFSRIPVSLKGAKFGNYNTDTEAKKTAFQACNYYAHEVSKENPIRLFIQGNNGTGKSHLALSVLRSILSKAKNEMSCLFISEQEIIELIQSTYNNNSKHTVDYYYKILQDVDLLVIDDLGQQLSKDHALGIIKNVINKRSGKSLIVTTNMSNKQLTTDRRFTTLNSKIKENAHVVEFITEDYRQRNVQYLNAKEKHEQIDMTDYSMTQKNNNNNLPYDLDDPPF